MRHDMKLEVVRGEPRYPVALTDLEHPPERLFVLGNPEALQAPCISIIGARDATPYGLALAEITARLAVEAGITVVSGGALGCDSAAGTAALDAGGRHVVVLGTGADVWYPRSSAPMVARALDRGGAVISLERWGSPPRRYAFPKRNKVIAALSSATVVTEAGMPSGTFSTAETAATLGREVLAIPGSVLSPESRGSNYLISVGATCISDFDALESAISRIYGTLRYPRADDGPDVLLDDTSRRVMKALVANPMRVEELAAAMGISSMDAMQILGDLTVRGMVSTLFDGRFAPTKFTLHAKTPLGHNG